MPETPGASVRPPRQAPAGLTRGPAVPTSQAAVAHRPLGTDQVRITGGPWARWQRVNREATLPHAADQLEEAGNLQNLRLAAGEQRGTHRGPMFMDSDVYKVLEAVAWELGRRPDPALERFLDDCGRLLERAQTADGYLNSWFQVVEPDQRYAKLDVSHELYCAGHLFQAAVAAHRSVGEERLLGVARRLADHLVAEFLHGGRQGLDGHPVVETALVELYRLTGEASYLELARAFVGRRGQGLVGDSPRGAVYFQDHAPVRQTRTVLGHAVRALYLEAGVVDVAVETGDTELLETSARRWADMVATKTSLTGGVGSRHALEAFGDRFELPPDRAYNETCAAVASTHWSWRLLLATGAARYAELIERTLFNAVAASTAADGIRFFYVNPLQRRSDYLEDRKYGRRRPWFAVACCPPNVARVVASLGHYVATVTSSGCWLHQFVPCELTVEVPGGVAELSVETGYPWDGEVRVTVRSTPPAPWTLALRVPSWSQDADLVVAGRRHPLQPDEHAYVNVTRAWRPGDTVTLRLDLTPRLTYPHQRIDALRGCVAVERGPLVYCFEQADQADGVDVEELTLPAATRLRVLDADDLPGVGRTAVLEADAAVASQPPPAGLPYGPQPPDQLVTTRPVTARAIPYFQWDHRDGAAMRVWMPLTTVREPRSVPGTGGDAA